MARVEQAVEIARPPAEVFAFLADARNDARWQVSLVGQEGLPDRPTAVGDRWVEVRRLAGRDQRVPMEMTDIDPPRRIGFRVTDGPMDARGHIAVDPAGAGARVTYRADLEGRGAMRLLAGTVARVMSDAMAGDLRRLKALLESEG